MSIKQKIVLLFVALVTLIVSIGSIVVYFYSLTERKDTFRKRLKSRALINARVYDGIKDTTYVVLRKLNTATVASLYDKSITIAGPDNVPDFMFSDNPGDSLYLTREILKEAKETGEYYFSYNGKTVVAVHQADDNRDFTVAIAARDKDGSEYLEQLRRILLFILALAAALSYLAGLVFAKNLVRPIQKITNEVNLITSNNLSKHIKVSSAKDELNKLSQTFNNLLDRLQDSFAIQRNFISNASHELSTPLTSISSQLEVAMQKKRTPEEYKEVMESVYEDIKELQQLTHSLLDIAKTGTQGAIDLTEVRLDEVLLKVISDIKKQNEDYNIVLNFEVFPENERLVTAFGNANLIYIAFKNIIENGCKYADNQESIVTAIFNKTNMIIKVANKGDVIAESDIQNIFQPFFRALSAQSKQGFGLGLTLTKRILSLHKGTITVNSDTENGTIFTITLPNILSLS